jgi:hypothetical protein
MADDRLLGSLAIDNLDRKKEPRHVVRARGLPYSCCGAEVVEFFSDHINIVNGEAGVHFTLTKGIDFEPLMKKFKINAF